MYPICILCKGATALLIFASIMINVIFAYFTSLMYSIRRGAMKHYDYDLYIEMSRKARQRRRLLDDILKKIREAHDDHIV